MYIPSSHKADRRPSISLNLGSLATELLLLSPYMHNHSSRLLLKLTQSMSQWLGRDAQLHNCIIFYYIIDVPLKCILFV